MSTTTTDNPSAIDYDAVIERLARYGIAAFSGASLHPKICDEAIAAVEALRIKNKELGAAIASEISQELIDEVEALRARVAELEDNYKLYKHIAKSIRGALDGEHTQRDILREFDIVVERAEAAEAHVIVLVGALGQVHECCLFGDDDAGSIGITTDPHINEQLFSDICAALATIRTLKES